MTLKVIADNGKAVDWFFMYKLPAGATDPTGESARQSTGYEYVYFDANAKQVALSKHTLKEKGGALTRTLAPLRQLTSTAGRIFYNDEKPRGTNDNDYGHTKGMLAFDTRSDTAFWLVQSTPKFPSTSSPAFPRSGHGNGQTFLCMTLENVAAAEAIASIMHQQQQPQTYGCEIPKSLGKDSPLRRLSKGVDLASKDDPVVLRFRSKAGKEFRLFAKNKAWHDDIWRNLVAVDLGVDLDVETWRRLTLSRDRRGGKESRSGKQSVEDVRYINLEHIGIPYEWRYTKDHAKLGTSREYDWVIVGDINRDESQSNRGGGAVGFQSPLLWDSLTRVEVIYDAATDLQYQKRLVKKKRSARPIKSRGAARSVTSQLDASEIGALERIAKTNKAKTLGDAVKVLIDKAK